MSSFLMCNGGEVFRHHSEDATRNSSASHGDVLQHDEEHPSEGESRNSCLNSSAQHGDDEEHLSEGEMVSFPGPLLRPDMPMDQLMKFIKAKSQECLSHLDDPDQQKSFFFWSIMERIISKNGNVLMPEIALLLFKGHSLLKRRLGRVVNQEDWCLPLAELLCSTTPGIQLAVKIITMGDDFVSRGWWRAAQICYITAGMELGERPQFKLIGCESFPQDGNIWHLMEMMEKTEVFEFAMSLFSGCGQLLFQDFKIWYACELDDTRQCAQALDYCKSIFTEILNLPDPLELDVMDSLLNCCRDLIRGRSEPEWVTELSSLVKDLRGPPKFDLSQHDVFDSRFTMGKLLGEGTFGSVFAGVRKADGKEVAIKYAAKHPSDEYITIPGETCSLPMEVALMKMVTKSPRCEHVIEMLEWLETPTHFIMVLERPNPCITLFEFCRVNNKCLPEAVAKRIMRQVVEAARHCCDRGVLHRDIKGENILINPHTLKIKLIDFGCGTLLKDGWYCTMAGTAVLWPFEWLHRGKYRGVPATIWGLGVLLFNLVCGHLPFLTEKEIIKAELKFSSKLSDDCCSLISWCLERSTKKRASFQDILNHNWFNQRGQNIQNSPADEDLIPFKKTGERKDPAPAPPLHTTSSALCHYHKASVLDCTCLQHEVMLCQMVAAV